MMYDKKISRIFLIILAVIVIIQGILLIVNFNPFSVIVHTEVGLFEYLSIVFWAIIFIEIGTIIGVKYLKKE